MKPSEYLEETEKAVQQLFDGLAFYGRILEEDPRPIFLADVSPDDVDAWNESCDRWYQEHKSMISKSREKQREYLGYSFSQGTLAGAILQIASMGISLFSTNTEVPESCKDFVQPHSKPTKFCVGRSVRGIPIGLIILAARDQYNHWDAPQLKDLNVKVFNRIANASGEYTDPAFDLTNPRLQIYSHNVISLLEWKNYEAYLVDVSSLMLE